MKAHVASSPLVEFRAEVEAYDQNAEVRRWDGPRYRMTYRVLGDGPTLILCPGIASTYRSYAWILNRLAVHFRTILFDYPGEDPTDGARLGQITHDDLVDDLFGLMQTTGQDRAFLVGLSFGSTVVFSALTRDPERFPRAAVQGGFARRSFSTVEQVALALGRRLPGRVGQLPLHDAVLAWHNKAQFPVESPDRWTCYVQQNGQTPIAPMAHRLDLVAGLDLRPILPRIATELLLIQGADDRIVSRRYYEELLAGLPNPSGLLWPDVGHQPHFTHPDELAEAIRGFLQP